MKSKKFLLSLIVILLIFVTSCVSVFADTTTNEVGFDDSLIIDFNYKPDVSLQGMKPITINFKSLKKIDNLKVSVFCTSTDKEYADNYRKYICIYDSSWDFENMEEEELAKINTFFIKFKEVNEPVDDPLTPEDETLNAIYEYELKIKLFETNYGLYKLNFEYDSNSFVYDNDFYIQNVIYRTDVDNIPTNDEKTIAANLTFESILSGSIAALCCVFGTIVIILVNDRKKEEDDEE